MKVSDVLKEGGKKISFEICPPAFGKAPERAYEILDSLMKCNPGFVSITYHQEIIKLVRKDNGDYQKVVAKTKAGTFPLCALLESRYNIPVVQHLLCAGFSRKETSDILKEMAYVKLWNVFALRGDPITENGEKEFVKHPDGHAYASELVEQISNFNQGKHHLNNILDQIKTEFCVGVAGYPEIHCEAPNLKYDLNMLKNKIDKGADYIIAQMFYSNNSFFNFVEKARETGINKPIIPGLNPLLSKEDLRVLPKRFGVRIPQKLVDEIYSGNDVKEASICWLVKQGEELLKNGVPGLHFYTEGRDSKIKIASEVYRRIFG